MKIWKSLLTPIRNIEIDVSFLLDFVEKEQRSLAIFDLETTGFLHANGFGIMEVGVLYILPSSKAIEGARIVSACSLIDPKETIGYKAREITGITQSMIKGQPTFDEAWLRPFQTMFDNDIMMGFNSKRFDVHGVIKDAERYGVEMNEPEYHIDVRSVANRVFETNKGKLGDFAKRLSVSVEGDAHRALADVLMTAGIANEIIRHYGEAAFIKYGDYRSTQAITATKKSTHYKSKTPLKETYQSTKSVPNSELFTEIKEYLNKHPYKTMRPLSQYLGMNEVQLSLIVGRALHSGDLPYEFFYNNTTQDAIKAALADIIKSGDVEHSLSGDLKLKPLREKLPRVDGRLIDYTDLRVALNQFDKIKKPVTAKASWLS